MEETQEKHVPWSGRSPRVGNGNSLQYSGLEIPWTEEPVGLQSMESQRVQHDSCICLSQAPNVSLPQHFSNGYPKVSFYVVNKFICVIFKNWIPHMSVVIWYLCFCVLLSMTFPRSIHVAEHCIISFYGWVIFHCTTSALFILCRWTFKLLPCLG